MAYIAWTKDYFDWQFSNDTINRRIAAWDGDKLAGIIAGRSADFLIEGNSISGAQYSWLSIPKAYQGRRLAPRLDEARVQLEQQHKTDLVISYRFHGSRHSLAEKTVRQTASTPAKDFNRNVGFWARPLDATLLRKWNLKTAEGWLAQLAGPLLPPVTRVSGSGIRDFRADDLASCLDIVQTSQHKFVIANDWNVDSLRWQLNGHPVTQTVVAEIGGEVKGFVNFHIQPFEGRTRQLVGMIDLACCEQLPFLLQRKLMNDVLARMKEQSAILALKLRTADLSTAVALTTGFSFQSASSALVLQWIAEPQKVRGNGPIRLLWR